LQPETALTFTGGLVYTPSFLSGLSLTVDYFSVDISNAIGEEGSALILNNCYRTAVHSDCEKIHRDPTSKQTVLVDDPLVNLGGERAAGVDFDVAFRFLLRPIGSLRLGVGGTWLQRFEATVPGDIVVNGLGNADLGPSPTLKLNFSALWAKAGWGAAA